MIYIIEAVCVLYTEPNVNIYFTISKNDGCMFTQHVCTFIYFNICKEWLDSSFIFLKSLKGWNVFSFLF